MGTGGGLVVIDFSAQGNSAFFRRDGWSGQEPDRVWAVGSSAVLEIPFQASGRTIQIEAELSPVEPSAEVNGQIVRVGVNGVAMGWLRVERRSMLRFEIDSAVTGDRGMSRIVFEFPGCFSPASLGRSRDNRPLACWFSFVRVYTTDMFRPGPWFPASNPNIPVVWLSPPMATGDGVSVLNPAAPIAREATLSGGPVTLTEGALARFDVPVSEMQGDFALRLELGPTDPGQAMPVEQLTLLLDRLVVGQFQAGERTTWLVPLPRELTEQRDTLRFAVLAGPFAAEASQPRPARQVIRHWRIVPVLHRFPASGWCGDQAPRAIVAEFMTEDAAALSAAIEAATGLDPTALMRMVESLGGDRVLGRVQQLLGAKVIGLFQQCDGQPADVARALEDDLRHVADPNEIAMDRDPRGFVVTIPAYNLRWTMPDPGGDDSESARRQACAIEFGYLRRKFFEGLRGGRKIHVLVRRAPVAPHDALTLLRQLERYGRASLLLIEEAGDGRRPGEVELLLPGLMRGYVRGLDLGAAWERFAIVDWPRVIANAAIARHRAAVREAA